MTQAQKIADFNSWQKRTTTVMRHTGKSSNWSFPKSKRQYWYSQGISSVKKYSYQQQILYKYINKKQYQYKLTTTWSTATQTPYSKSVAQKVEERKYLYWYRNPAFEYDQPTTDPAVCRPYGCVKDARSYEWKVVQSCTPGEDSEGFKIECQSNEVGVSWAAYCPARNGQFVAGIGTVKCEGSNVSAYSGPVEACNTIYPTLKDQILAAGGDPANLVVSNCVPNTVTKYVTSEQCEASKNVAPVFPDYKTTTCQQTTPSNVIDNSCPVGSPVVSGNADLYRYTHCTKEDGAKWVAECSPATLPVTEGNEMERTCVDRGAPKLTETVAPGACRAGINGNYFVECSSPPDSNWSGPVQQGSSNCQTSTDGGKTCARQNGGWVPAEICSEELPSADNGWIGVECANASGGTASCQPAPGTEGLTPPSSGPVAPGTCFDQVAAPENGCIYHSCTTNYTGPNKVPSCVNADPTAPNWQKVSCVYEPQRNVPVQNCSVTGATNCRDHIVHKDMSYGTCANALNTVLGGSNPVEQNNWTTSSCDKVDVSTDGGLTYMRSAEEFAACQSSTNSDGVKTSCVEESVTVNVAEGELCVPGYDATTHKVTDCSGVGQGTSTVVPTKPANCPAATCEEVKGNKKVFIGSYSSYKINLVGTAETGVPQLINPPGIVNFSGDLESPAICYSPDDLSAGATLPQPAEGRPQPGTVAWSALPAEFQACSKLPCEQSVVNSVSGGSTNSLADVAQYYYATDLRPGDANSSPRGWDNLVRPAGSGPEDDKATWQHMATYVIGMGVSGTLKFDQDYKNGAGDFAALRTGAKTWPIWPVNGTTNFEQPQSIDDFWHTAVNGRGRYFSANDPKAIEIGLGEVFSDIRAAVGSGAGVAVSSAVVEAGNNFAYGAQYRSGRWSGDVLAYTIDTANGARTQIENWSAKDRLSLRKDGADERKIYYKPADATTLVDFKFGSLSSGLQTFFTGTAAESRLSQYGQMTTAQKDVALGANLVSFLRGDTTKEGYVKSNLNKLYRTRDGVLGDIIGSQPVFVGKPQRRYKSETYTDYRLAQQNRRPMVYVGGNDGMLHAFHAETDWSKKEMIGNKEVLTAAREAWAFVPKAAMAEMPRLASVEYESNHRYFVDGTPVVADVEIGGAWKTILVGGFNKGGKGYYALDITDPLAPKGLWETYDNSALASMGQSFGKPLVTKLPNGTWVVMVTSGYNNADGRGYVYVLNAATGQSVHTIVNPTGSGMKELNNFVKDPVGDNTTKLFYGGDIEGNIWRYEWNGSSYTTTKVVQLTDASGTPQPITTRLELVQGNGSQGLPRILVATGKLMGVADLTSTAQQSIYGIDDVYASNGSGSGITSGVSMRTSMLKKSELTNVTGANGKLTRELACSASTSAADCKDGSKGWYIDLPDTGERVNVDLRLAGSTLVVSSNVPSNEPCVAGGKGWVNYLNYETGLAVNGNEDGKGPAGEPVDGGLIAGNDLSANKDNDVTSHVSPSQFPEKPIDLKIPVATPKPLGKRISWRELVK
ncbi:pilus assembly protein [Comamonas sp. J-3]|uniref:pilus assembly protein n=1 Tax=Comamonas trifloxystrobinivorans TaxID=3350256 RepID=UPI00372C5255